MPRPARFTVDALLDAATQILADDGPAAVTMSAVARATGAPSGSMYHRFPTRAQLCGALWVRTEERFQTGLIAAVEGPGDQQDRCASAARYTVRWCREHPAEARVLLAGPDALGRADWPAELDARRRTLHRRLSTALRQVDAPTDRITAALVDIPAAVVRRHLGGRRPIPAGVEQIVDDCARALIPRG